MELQDNSKALSIQQGLGLCGFWVKKETMYGETDLRYVSKISVFQNSIQAKT